ncbi:MAG TPA: hypothetical protein VJB02_03760 [Coxiellaceae bacterium]|nr:hypothetical protein [Coxiellaceae bacterium]
MHLEKKQKIMVAVTVLTFALLIWQVYDMMVGDVTPVTPPAKPAVVKKADASKKANKPVEKKAENLSTSSVTVQSQSKSQSQASSIKAQAEYVSLANQYELAKMQRQLLEQELAIAQTRNNIAKLNEETSNLGSAADSSTSLSTADNSGMRLAYLAKQGNRWVATLVKNGEFMNVSAGDSFVNGLKILNVNEDGIILDQGNTRMQVNFQGIVGQSILYPEPPTDSLMQVSRTLNLPEVKLEDDTSANRANLERKPIQ